MTQTTKNAEELSAAINKNRENILGGYGGSSQIDIIQSALTAEYERGKADVVGAVNPEFKDFLNMTLGQFSDRVEAARAEGEWIGFERAQQWQPIETAPKDGSCFLAGQVGVKNSDKCYFDKYGYLVIALSGGHKSTHTHWMSLPAAPSPTSKRSDELLQDSGPDTE